MTKYDILKSACFTGHRELPEIFSVDKLKKKIESVIILGYDTFYCGMALGFDSMCFLVLEELRKKYKIKIIAAVPCDGQDEKFSISQKIEYRRMLDSADEVVYVSHNYTPDCMLKRNRYMVDNSSLVIAYYHKEKTGTSYTVNYAAKENKKIITV